MSRRITLLAATALILGATPALANDNILRMEQAGTAGLTLRATQEGTGNVLAAPGQGTTATSAAAAVNDAARGSVRGRVAVSSRQSGTNNRAGVNFSDSSAATGAGSELKLEQVGQTNTARIEVGVPELGNIQTLSLGVRQTGNDGFMALNIGTNGETISNSIMNFATADGGTANLNTRGAVNNVRTNLQATRGTVEAAISGNGSSVAVVQGMANQTARVEVDGANQVAINTGTRANDLTAGAVIGNLGDFESRSRTLGGFNHTVVVGGGDGNRVSIDNNSATIERTASGDSPDIVPAAFANSLSVFTSTTGGSPWSSSGQDITVNGNSNRVDVNLAGSGTARLGIGVNGSSNSLDIAATVSGTTHSTFNISQDSSTSGARANTARIDGTFVGGSRVDLRQISNSATGNVADVNVGSAMVPSFVQIDQRTQ